MIVAESQGFRYVREFSMPAAYTFKMKPALKFVANWVAFKRCVVDPFSGRSSFAHYTNDIDPASRARDHMDAILWLDLLAWNGVRADCVIIDPPYSPRQIAEVYRKVGRPVTMADTQSARFKKRVRDLVDELLVPGGVVLSFGWNTVGMGSERGYRLAEVLDIYHGGDHSDTLCTAEIKL